MIPSDETQVSCEGGDLHKAHPEKEGNVRAPAGEEGGLTNVREKVDQRTVEVPTCIVKDSVGSARDILIQQTIGGFLFCGSFWLILEHFLSGEDGESRVIWFCIPLLLAGLIVSAFGWRAALRRATLLRAYLPKEATESLVSSNPKVWQFWK